MIQWRVLSRNMSLFPQRENNMLQLMSIASALNLRSQPNGTVLGELLSGDLFQTDKPMETWVYGKVLTGPSAGRSGFVRRKWLIQHFEAPVELTEIDRSKAVEIISERTAEFDAIHYKLGDKAKTWPDLRSKGYIDCSGWLYLLAKELFAAYQVKTKPSLLYTFSDEQITNVGSKTGQIISGSYLVPELFQPGCIVGIDFAEYSWDRDRPLDIDHVVIICGNESERFVSQSSSGGGGVNTVPLSKWLASTANLRASGRMHLVDLLALK